MIDTKRVVYVLTTGEYSSYTICGVYDTLEEAQRQAGSPMRYHGSTEVQEWTLGSPGVESEQADSRDGRQGVKLQTWVYKVSGRVHGVPQEWWSPERIGESPYYFSRFEPDIWVDPSANMVTVYAVDRERGLKALRDKVAEIKAVAEGLT